MHGNMNVNQLCFFKSNKLEKSLQPFILLERLGALVTACYLVHGY